MIGDILWHVISREGRSKKYTDLLPLDGGTVGIANFAVGGLSDLYRQMDTEKYFNKSQTEMIENYSTSCRPPHKSGNDTGWGCYSKPWWRNGMKSFLNSPSKEIQNKAWALKMKPVIEEVISKGWTSKRQIAIALGITNSVGSAGFKNYATKKSWNAERTLEAYVGLDPKNCTNQTHRCRRAIAINRYFPLK